MKQFTMKLLAIIFLWKLCFFINFIQCEINTTITLLFPSIINHPHQILPLSEQAIYDLKNSLRLSKQMVDFDDEDYNEDDEIENDNQLIVPFESTTTSSEIDYKILKSSSFRFAANFIYLLLLLLLLLILTETNK